MKTILTYIRPKMGQMSVQLFIKFAGTIVELLLPWMLSVILDTYAAAGDRAMIWVWGGLMTLCAAGALAGNVIANRMATRISRDITRNLRRDLFEKITHLSARQEDAFTTPSLISRLTSDTYNVHQMIDRMQRLGVRAPILLLGGIAVTLSMEPVLTLVLLAALPLLGIIVFFVSRKGIRLYTRTQQALDSLIRRAQESMSGIRVIQALSKTEYEKAQFDKDNREAAQRECTAGLLMNLTNPVMNLVLNTGLTLVIIVGAFRTNAGDTQPGTIIAFLSYFTIILNALMMVSRLFVMYSKGAASGRRIAEVLDAPEEMKFSPQPAGNRTYHIEFDRVSFSYAKRKNNIDNISFALRKGETLGIIGPTGSGKSTILRLLLRLYDPDIGAVYIDGQDVRSIPPQKLYSKFGVVFQNDFLHAGSIAENIDFGRGLTHRQRTWAAQMAQAEFIKNQKDGFDRHIASRGTNLSGGQKQRVLLARALANRPQILLLDDSSSALDYKTDAALRRALTENLSGTTKIIVAQRISSIRYADHILVMEEGHMIGYGTHEQLLDACSVYREIVRIQMPEGFIQNKERQE